MIEKSLCQNMLHNEILLKEAELLKKKYKIKLKNICFDEYGRRHIYVKLIDKFNYVIHIDFKLNDNNYITEYRCDYGEQCENNFCCHCMLFYQYLTNEYGMEISGFECESDDENSEAFEAAEAYHMPSVEELFGEEAYDDILPAEETYKDYENFPEAASEEPPEKFYGDDITEACEENTEEAYTEAEALQSFEEAEPRQMQIILGTDTETNEPVFLFPNNTDCVLNNNIGIIGTMGTGKTQFTKSLITQFHINQKDNYDGLPLGILIFDYKGDYNRSKTDFVAVTEATVIKPYKIKYNPFSLSHRRYDMPLMPLHIANTFTDTISKIYGLGSKQTSVLLESITEAYRQQGISPENEATWNRPAPTFEQVYRIYEAGSFGNVKDSLSAVMSKLHNFMIFEPDPLKTVSLAGLLKGTVVIDLSGYDEDIQSLIVAITLDQFYSQMHAGGSSKTDGKLRQLKTFIFVDEADNFMKMGIPSLKKILKEGREFGAGVILSTQSLKHFCSANDDYSKYMITWVIHNVSDLNRRDVEFVLKSQQRSEEAEELFMSVKSLKKHESIVKISNDKPVKMQDKPFWQLYNEISGRN